MYKCEMDKGVMTFRNNDVTYTPTGRTLTDMNEVVKEYDLVQEILRDHAWAFPVIEKLNIRSNALLKNLMELFNGRNIQYTENDVATTATAGRDSSDAAGRRTGKKTQEAQGTQ